jgi:hypothetical protein
MIPLLRIRAHLFVTMKRVSHRSDPHPTRARYNHLVNKTDKAFVGVEHPGWERADEEFP